MRAAMVQASLRIRAVSPEPSLLAHISSESRGNFRQKARSLAPLNGWACAVIICHDGMLEDTNSLDGAHIKMIFSVHHVLIPLNEQTKTLIDSFSCLRTKTYFKTKKIKCCAVYDVPRARGTVQETSINYIFKIYFDDIFCLNIHNI